MGVALVLATSMTQSTSDKIYVNLLIVSLCAAGSSVSSGKSGASKRIGPSIVEGEVPKGHGGGTPPGVEGDWAIGEAPVREGVRRREPRPGEESEPDRERGGLLLLLL